MSGAAEERLARDPSSELWGDHLSRYRSLGTDVAGLRVLDAACGSGFGLEHLASLGARGIGLDLDLDSLRAVRVQNRGAWLVRGDAGSLPLADASLDLVVSFETIEHVPDPGRFVREMARVLAPDGRAVISTPNRAFGPPELHLGNPFHLQEYTAPELRDLLAASFESVDLYGQWVDPFYRFVPFLMVERELSPGALSWKALNRLPFPVKDRVARWLPGRRSFYPGPSDYTFVRDRCDGAHTLYAVARHPRRAAP